MSGPDSRLGTERILGRRKRWHSADDLGPVRRSVRQEAGAPKLIGGQMTLLHLLMRCLLRLTAPLLRTADGIVHNRERRRTIRRYGRVDRVAVVAEQDQKQPIPDRAVAA
jgi:hypothetical protein